MAHEAPSTYVASRRIGEADVIIISEGSCQWAPRFQVPEAEWRRALPEADAGGRIPIGFNLVHVRCGGASIIIDPGFDDPLSSWQQGFAAHSPSLADIARTPGLEAALAGIDVAPGGVTHVLITHTHADHFAGIMAERDGGLRARFPRARHILGRAAWETNPRREEPASDFVVRLGAIHRLGLLDLIDEEREIVPGVTMIPSPGEMPGHMIVRIQSGGECFYYLGDLFHHACEVEHPDWSPPGRDLPALRASRQAFIADAADSGATAVYAHARFPGWGRIRRTADGVRWESR